MGAVEANPSQREPTGLPSAPRVAAVLNPDPVSAAQPRFRRAVPVPSTPSGIPVVGTRSAQGAQDEVRNSRYPRQRRQFPQPVRELHRRAVDRRRCFPTPKTVRSVRPVRAPSAIPAGARPTRALTQRSLSSAELSDRWVRALVGRAPAGMAEGARTGRTERTVFGVGKHRRRSTAPPMKFSYRLRKLTTLPGV